MCESAGRGRRRDRWSPEPSTRVVGPHASHSRSAPRPRTRLAVRNSTTARVLGVGDHRAATGFAPSSPSGSAAERAVCRLVGDVGYRPTLGVDAARGSGRAPARAICRSGGRAGRADCGSPTVSLPASGTSRAHARLGHPEQALRNSGTPVRNIGVCQCTALLDAHRLDDRRCWSRRETSWGR